MAYLAQPPPPVPVQSTYLASAPQETIWAEAGVRAEEVDTLAPVQAWPRCALVDFNATHVTRVPRRARACGRARAINARGTVLAWIGYGALVHILLAVDAYKSLLARTGVAVDAVDTPSLRAARIAGAFVDILLQEDNKMQQGYQSTAPANPSRVSYVTDNAGEKE